MQKYMIEGAIVPNSMPSLAAARLEKILIMKYRGCVENLGKDNRDYFNELTVDAVVTEIEDATSLTLDFKDLEYISSAGLRTLMAAQEHMEDHEYPNVKVININETIQDIFKLTGFDSMLDVEK
ncbi:MAG: STAS domain-containing protein [Parasporobacterium sp.]|nr:STAS domain-containing protein [Parasporobacterium sp.]